MISLVYTSYYIYIDRYASYVLFFKKMVVKNPMILPIGVASIQSCKCKQFHTKKEGKEKTTINPTNSILCCIIVRTNSGSESFRSFVHRLARCCCCFSNRNNNNKKEEEEYLTYLCIRKRIWKKERSLFRLNHHELCFKERRCIMSWLLSSPYGPVLFLLFFFFRKKTNKRCRPESAAVEE